MASTQHQAVGTAAGADELAGGVDVQVGADAGRGHVNAQVGAHGVADLGDRQFGVALLLALESAEDGVSHSSGTTTFGHDVVLLRLGDVVDHRRLDVYREGSAVSLWQ